MEQFLNDNPSLKRLAVTTLGSGILAAADKAGVSHDVIMAIAGLIGTYLLQSGVVSMAKAKAEAAAAAVDSPAKAAEVLGGTVAK